MNELDKLLMDSIGLFFTNLEDEVVNGLNNFFSVE